MDRIADSDWLAPMVVAAFTDGRFELGAALARLAVQARRMEAAESRAIASASVPVYDEATGHMYGQERVQEAVQAVMQEPAQESVQPAVNQHIPTARCIAIVTRDGVATECHGVLYLAATDSAIGEVRHLEPKNNDHLPFPDREFL